MRAHSRARTLGGMGNQMEHGDLADVCVVSHTRVKPIGAASNGCNDGLLEESDTAHAVVVLGLCFWPRSITSPTMKVLGAGGNGAKNVASYGLNPVPTSSHTLRKAVTWCSTTDRALVAIPAISEEIFREIFRETRGACSRGE